ncbi:class I SAM-dependent methyltransferase [Nocardia grenadensis]|uniref:class I SAM-dependent methyltransferase n=2 Tax=Nocardia grenadensis TaxID=931537 RepID=UPI003D710A19
MPENPLAAVDPWDRIAEDYAVSTISVMRPFAAAAVRLAGLAGHTRPARVVDVAAGPGTLSLLAAEHAERVDAVDFSAPMIEQLERAVTAAGADNVVARVGDGQELPFADAEFDAAFSMFGLMFFPDRARGFAELFRVLRPGGVAVVSSWAPADRSTWMQMSWRALGSADPDIRPPAPNLASLENSEVFEREMCAAGFERVSVVPHTVETVFADADALLARLTRGNARLELMRRSIGDRAMAERIAAMRSYLTEHYRPGSPLTTTAYLGVGYR